MMIATATVLCFAPLAISGWLAGLRGGRWILVGLMVCLLTLMSGLVVVDNAGDPPDAYPSSVFMIVGGIFMLFVLAGIFTREYRMNKNSRAAH